jgi:hypothetical protein
MDQLDPTANPEMQARMAKLEPQDQPETRESAPNIVLWTVVSSSKMEPKVNFRISHCDTIEKGELYFFSRLPYPKTIHATVFSFFYTVQKCLETSKFFF